MKKSEKLPPRQRSDKGHGKGLVYYEKEQRHSVKAEEEDFRNNLSRRPSFFRACDDEIINMNGLKESSKNLKLDKPLPKDNVPILTRRKEKNSVKIYQRKR